MHRHRRTRLLRWILPLVFGQLLLPMGVMPGQVRAHAALIMCSTHTSVLHSVSDSQNDPPSTHTSVHKDSVCPFATVALSGLTPTDARVVQRVATSPPPWNATAQANPPAGSPRMSPDTGPPTRFM